jgi:hypothetical protein
VVVDGAADVEICGDQGVIKNVSGRPSEWRRFECSASLPGKLNTLSQKVCSPVSGAGENAGGPVGPGL